MPSHNGYVIALAMLSGTNTPTVIAYQITGAPSDGFMYDMVATPFQSDFARYEDGAWHLVDDFNVFEEMASISYLDGLTYAGLAERSYLSPLDSADDVTTFEWLIDINTLPITHDRNAVPSEIECLVQYINRREKFGTPLFPYIACSLSRTRVAMMHGRYSSKPKASEPAHVASYPTTVPTGHGNRVPWHWDLYDYLSVLVDADGQEVLEFDEDQMLVRSLPSGKPVTAFTNRQSLENREADRRGIKYDGPLDFLMTQRCVGIDQHLSIDYRDWSSWSGMRWTHQGNLYVLRDANDNALLGLDLDRMRIYMANGTFSDCIGDPGGTFEIALHLTDMARSVIDTTDVTGMPANESFDPGFAAVADDELPF